MSERTSFGRLIESGALEIGDGYRAKNEELGGAGPIFLRAAHVRETHIDFEGADRFHAELLSSVEAKMARPGDTLVTTKGSTGRTAFVTADLPGFVYSPHISYWRSLDSDRLDPLFLRYWAVGPEFRQQLHGMEGSTDMAPYLSLTDQRRLRITLPDPDEQRAIGRLLVALDDKIALNRRMTRTLDAMSATLFEAWRDDNASLATCVRADELCSKGVLMINDGYRAKNSEMAKAGLPFARAGNLQSHFEFTGADLLGEAGIRAAREKISKPFDCVFTSKGTVGRIAQVLPSTPRFVYSPQLCFWRSLRPDVLNPLVLAQWMNASEFREQVDAVKGQTDMADYVSLRDQRQMEITLPLGANQALIGERLEALVLRKDLNYAESRTLSTLRDQLLPRLLAGTIRLHGVSQSIAMAQ